MTLRMTGVEAHLRKLRDIRDIEDEKTMALLETGELIRQEAMRSIREGTVRGYGHVPSRPGETPKGDTGELELGIVVRPRASGKTVEVVSTAPYSIALEFGTHKMAERPFMRPAAKKHKSRLAVLMAQALNGKIARVHRGSK
jgi:HK97 gp10 family phage protein